MNEPPSPASGEREVLSVSDLNRRVRSLLEHQLGTVWIEAEISNFTAARSGHWYFTLKDAHAQVRCAMFRGRNTRLRFRPEDGLQVLARARTGLYEARGEFQLIVDSMEESGDGALRRAFEELKQKLQQEGLFDPERKQTLPDWPRRIGVVTSSTGAAVHDICTVLERRFPAIEVLVYPVSVQGKTAATEIDSAIRNANREPRCDVLIVGRGGGSLEDLWPFNEERVARAIAASKLPIVSAVGHETDFTIADFVADFRAPTPSAAAELLSPDQIEIRGIVQACQLRLAETQQRQIAARRSHLLMLAKRLRHPRQLLQERGQHLDHLDIRLGRAIHQQLQMRRNQVETRHARLLLNGPRNQISRIRLQTRHLHDRLARGMRYTLQQRKQEIASHAASLDQISPLSVLGRGYALLSNPQTGQLIRRAADAAPGDALHARLGEGSLRCTVNEVMEKQDSC